MQRYPIRDADFNDKCQMANDKLMTNVKFQMGIQRTFVIWVLPARPLASLPHAGVRGWQGAGGSFDI